MQVITKMGNGVMSLTTESFCGWKKW